LHGCTGTADHDAVLLVVRDRAAAERAGRGCPSESARLVDRRVEHADTVLRAVQRALADVMNGGVGHAHVRRVGDDAVVVGTGDVGTAYRAGVRGPVVDADVAAGRVNRA